MSKSPDLLDVFIVGAGPTGLAAAIEAERFDLGYVVVEKGCITNSIFHFPTQMVFFTTPELLEIGNMPLVCEREKANRNEALKYYRKVVQATSLNIHQYEEVHEISRGGGEFRIETAAGSYRARNVVLAIGYYDNPNMLGIPGEDLPHVSHYYTEAHSFFERDVVVIGGQNSAAEAALELYRAGARVTLLHRNKELGKSLKYWVGPDMGQEPYREKRNCGAPRHRGRRNPSGSGPGSEELNRDRGAGRPSFCVDRLSTQHGLL